MTPPSDDVRQAVADLKTNRAWRLVMEYLAGQRDIALKVALFQDTGDREVNLGIARALTEAVNYLQPEEKR